MIEKTCPRCGHINWFSLQRLCTGSDDFVLMLDAGQSSSAICELVVTCQSSTCDHTWTFRADCGPYL